MAEPCVVHRSKVDAWLIGVLAACAAGMLVLGGGVIVRNQPLDAMFGCLFIGMALFVLWVLLSVRYLIFDSRLVVRAGPFRRTIPLHRIEEVFPSRGLAPAFAPSRDRLRINYHVDGKWAYTLVSPRDKAAFLGHLAAADPGLALSGLRVVRRVPPV